MSILNQSYNSNQNGKLLVITLIVIFVIIIGFTHFKWGPWIFYRIDGSMREGAWYNEMHYWMIIQDNIYSVWWDHSGKLLDAEESLSQHQIETAELDPLASLPGVIDAFYLSISEDKHLSTKGVIPVDSLMNSPHFKRKLGSGTLAAGRQLGGMTRFKRIDNYPILFRVVGMGQSYIMPDQIIGLVLDENWFFDKLPARLDSLGKNSHNLTMFGPYFSDSLRNLQEDPFASPGGWKRSMGVMHYNDTLWWSGDPNVENTRFMDLSAFNLRISTKHMKPDFNREIWKETKFLLFTFIALDLIAALLLFFLYKTISLYMKQSSMNQIALSHLAHSIKTPVSRIRLDTDSLLEEMVTSPEEEREIIRAISHESSRMELAVQSAALSLQSGKREYSFASDDLSELVSETSEAWRLNFDHAKVNLIINKSDGNLIGKFDREMIAVMIDNLLDNALRHTVLNLINLKDKTAAVTVGLQELGGTAEIVISDMGGGIPVKERNHVFSQFRKTKADAGTGATGLGLGLALVKEIAEAHRGSVKISDNEVGGSKITVTLKLMD